MLVLTTPNHAWHWLVSLANRMRLRPCHGLENWARWAELQRWVAEAGITIDRSLGFNPIPFFHPSTYRVNDWLDRYGTHPVLGSRMINQMVIGHKPPAPAS
jgi:hypothetical protein